MPLYMDFHKGLSVTIEDVKNAHMADEKVQDKYGVKYHQFWVNEEAGAIFCLMEGPDRETCEEVHRVAHGNVACSVVEVEPGFFKLLMGEGHHVDRGHVQYADGTVDRGYRNILVVTIQVLTDVAASSDYKLLGIPHQERKLVQKAFDSFRGRELKRISDDGLIGVFNASEDAVRCAMEIQHELGLLQQGVDGPSFFFKIGLSAGQPVTEQDEFFGEALTLARRLCNIARNNEGLISALVNDLCDVKKISFPHKYDSVSIKSVNTTEENFINSLFRISEANLSNENFTIETLSRDIGISRPQLYRKIITLTGRSPNDLVRDLRMEKALALLKKRTANISEVALEVGYNNPSYFAKCFMKKFGCTPSKFVETLRVV